MSTTTMDDPSTDELWQQLPFPDVPTEEPGHEEDGALPAEEEAQTAPSDADGATTTTTQGPSRWIEHFTHRDYQLLPCNYVVRPADMLDAYSSLDSHSDYQGFLVSKNN
jgi:hypothetical protein